VHRDGADYNVIVMGRRADVDGGANTIYAADTREPIYETVLAEPGDFLLNNDRTTLHSATPVTQSGAIEGHRDVFIVSFIRIENHAASG
ncbi:MAG: 2OG-Fe dioxygenase family protein, partial [Gammaproteobacteria bacterium]